MEMTLKTMRPSDRIALRQARSTAPLSARQHNTSELLIASNEASRNGKAVPSAAAIQQTPASWSATARLAASCKPESGRSVSTTSQPLVRAR
jgi:hypothetical protein